MSRSTSLPRVLFVGDDWYGSNATSLRNAILRHGHDCLTFNSTSMGNAGLPRRIARRISPVSPSQSEWNALLVHTVKMWRPDVLFVFKGLAVTPEVLATTTAMCVHYHPDDSTNPENRSSIYDAAENHYDLHVTTKSFNVDELKARGVARAMYVPCAYDRDWHRPVPRDRSRSYVVGFIGTRRANRTRLINELADEWGRAFLICGDRWRRDLYAVRKATVQGPQYGFNLSRAVARAPVQLGLLNSYNRDRHTCRSFEIPAAGGLLVAERTDEHIAMLDDEKEVLLFSSADELRSHIKRTAREPEAAARMAHAASHRIRAEKNTYDDRWRTILEALS